MNLDLTPEQKQIVQAHPKYRLAYQIMLWFADQEKRGGTTDECAEALDASRDTISPRVAELAACGMLVLTQTKRLTRNNKPARVYICREGAQFIAFLGMPRRSRKAGRRGTGLDQMEQTMLDAAKTYVLARRKTQSEDEVREHIVKLLRTLNALA